MSVTSQVFFPELAILLTVKGLVWPFEVQARFYEAVAPLMDDSQFLAACSAALASERFMPTPVRLLELSQGDFKAQAEAAWQGISDRYAKHLSPLTDEGSESREVLAMIGATTERIERADFIAWDTIGRRFREVYAARLTAKATEAVVAATGYALPAPMKVLPANLTIAMATVDPQPRQRAVGSRYTPPKIDGPGGDFLAQHAARKKTRGTTADKLVSDLVRAGAKHKK